MRYVTVLVCACLSLATMAASAAGPEAQAASSEGQSEKAGTARSDAGKAKAAPAGDMVLSGLSILGNDETPKELVIVPDADHVDLYDNLGKIPFDKLEVFFKTNLG